MKNLKQNNFFAMKKIAFSKEQLNLPHDFKYNMSCIYIKMKGLNLVKYRIGASTLNVYQSSPSDDNSGIAILINVLHVGLWVILVQTVYVWLSRAGIYRIYKWVFTSKTSCFSVVALILYRLHLSLALASSLSVIIWKIRSCIASFLSSVIFLETSSLCPLFLFLLY